MGIRNPEESPTTYFNGTQLTPMGVPQEDLNGEQPKAKPLEILIVDDDPAVRSVLETTLRANPLAENANICSFANYESCVSQESLDGDIDAWELKETYRTGLDRVFIDYSEDPVEAMKAIRLAGLFSQYTKVVMCFETVEGALERVDNIEWIKKENVSWIKKPHTYWAVGNALDQL
jgi:hypothetical protein